MTWFYYAAFERLSKSGYCSVMLLPLLEKCSSFKKLLRHKKMFAGCNKCFEEIFNIIVDVSSMQTFHRHIREITPCRTRKLKLLLGLS